MSSFENFIHFIKEKGWVIEEADGSIQRYNLLYGNLFFDDEQEYD